MNQLFSLRNLNPICAYFSKNALKNKLSSTKLTLALASHRCPDKTSQPLHICYHPRKPIQCFAGFSDSSMSDCILSLSLFMNFLCAIPELPSFLSLSSAPFSHSTQSLQRIHAFTSNHRNLDPKIQTLFQMKIHCLTQFIWGTFYFLAFLSKVFICH